MKTDTLAMNNVQIVEQASDWREAIRISTAPLIANGYIRDCYSDAIIENVEKLGAYFLIAPGVAMPHARPEQGVIKTQLGITLFRNSVHFDGKEDDTRLFIVLAAEDSDKHIDTMVMIADALEDEGKIEELCSAENEEMLYKLFTS